MFPQTLICHSTLVSASAVLQLLATVALAMISINPSEASVERSFSAQKLTHSALRNTLADDAVEAHMYIKINAPLLTSNGAKWLSEQADEWTPADKEGVIETAG